MKKESIKCMLITNFILYLLELCLYLRLHIFMAFAKTIPFIYLMHYTSQKAIRKH